MANRPRVWAWAATSSATAMVSSVLAFWLRRQVSLMHTTTLTSSTPASTARSSPRRFKTSPAGHPVAAGDLSHDRLGVG